MRKSTLRSQNRASDCQTDRLTQAKAFRHAVCLAGSHTAEAHPDTALHLQMEWRQTSESLEEKGSDKGSTEPLSVTGLAELSSSSWPPLENQVNTHTCYSLAVRSLHPVVTGI